MAADDHPPKGEVEVQLNRLLTSETLGGAPRLQGFLRYVVNETLAGREDRLHAYTIGVNALERTEDFDPKTDPSVRVEAGRLRRRLERFYLTEGMNDPVFIEIPKGRYVPVFSRRTVAKTESKPDHSEVVDRARKGRPIRLIAAAVVLVLAVSTLYLSWQVIRANSEDGAADKPPSHDNGPTRMVVMPFTYTSTADPHPFLANGLVEELVASIAKLPDVEVVALGSAAQATAAEMSLEETAQALDVDYLIHGDVRQEGDRVRANIKIIETSSWLVQLSKRYDTTVENVLDLETEVARDVAGSVVEAITPELDRRLLSTEARNPEALALYHEAATLRDPPSDPVRSQLSEDAYRRVIELDPEFAGGYSGLAYVLGFRSWWGISEQPEADALAALEAARQAVTMDSQFGWAHMGLSIALNVTGDHNGSLEAARRAAELAPSDPYILVFSGLYQGFAGEIEAGATLSRSAIRLDPISPRTPYRNVTGVLHFHAGRYDDAIDYFWENLDLGGPDGPHMAYYRAGTLVRLGRLVEARVELEKVSAFSYSYEFDIRNLLRAFRDQRESDQLLDALAELGFRP